MKPTEPASWSIDRIAGLFSLPMNDLLYRAHRVHRERFDPNSVQKSKLINIKTGGCPEDCKYCSQSVRHATDVKPAKLMQVEEVVAQAKAARAQGATRYCMGAAWRSPRPSHLPHLCEMVRQVKALGMETCMTLGMLTQDAAEQLSDAGLDFYNHNIDTSPEYYGEVISTRTFEDRLRTLERVREAGMKVCCGGILGMGESRHDRMRMLQVLAGMEVQPESVPINMLVPIPGTPLGDRAPVEPLEFVRVIAVARIMLPGSMLRLSAGRRSMSDELQALCYFAGANSVFVGDRLLTTDNMDKNRDDALFSELGVSENGAGCRATAGKRVSASFPAGS